MNSQLKLMHAEAHDFLEKFARNFKPGVKFTLLARSPNFMDADFIVTDDKLGRAVKALKALMPRDVEPNQERASK